MHLVVNNQDNNLQSTYTILIRKVKAVIFGNYEGVLYYIYIQGGVFYLPPLLFLFVLVIVYSKEYLTNIIQLELESIIGLISSYYIYSLSSMHTIVVKNSDLYIGLCMSI